VNPPEPVESESDVESGVPRPRRRSTAGRDLLVVAAIAAAVIAPVALVVLRSRGMLDFKLPSLGQKAPPPPLLLPPDEVTITVSITKHYFTIVGRGDKGLKYEFAYPTKEVEGEEAMALELKSRLSTESPTSSKPLVALKMADGLALSPKEFEALKAAVRAAGTELDYHDVPVAIDVPPAPPGVAGQ
jgi:hypothetical protein